jgi:hypothetical protein
VKISSHNAPPRLAHSNRSPSGAPSVDAIGFLEKSLDMKSISRRAGSVAVCCALGFATASQAGVSIAGFGTVTPVRGVTYTAATALQVGRGGGSGHMAVIPYYSVQGGNSTLINITNTDQYSGKAVKVRFRSAVNADTVYNFTVLLGPSDVWAANVSQGADGRATLTTSDNTCTLPSIVNGAFLTNRLPSPGLTAAQQAAWTREGYVEIITMADVAPGDEFVILGSRPNNELLDAIQHNNGVARCGNDAAGSAALSLLVSDPPSADAGLYMGLDSPTTGLLVTSILINVFDASVAWTTPTTSITAVDVNGKPARGRLVFSPQTADPAPDIDLYTNDPLLRTAAGGGTGKIAAKQYDLPDLSTPYVGTAANAVDFPFRHVESLSAALAVKTLRNEYLLEPSINAHTDWTLTQPTRRFSVGVDYSASPAAIVANRAPAGPTRYFSGTRSLQNSRIGCAHAFRQAAPVFFDRSSGTRKGQATDSTPLNPLCGAAAVLVFDREAVTNSVLRASLTASSAVKLSGFAGGAVDYLPSSFTAGWAYLEAVSASGLPVIGAAYIGARGPQVAGKSTNFGVLYGHDLGR